MPFMIFDVEDSVYQALHEIFESNPDIPRDKIFAEMALGFIESLSYEPTSEDELVDYEEIVQVDELHSER